MSSLTVLSLDTSTPVCSVALLVDESVYELYEPADQDHSRRLLSMVEQVLQQGQLSLDKVDVFAFGAGPGSFTGLRIACSVVQGFGAALQKPVIPVSTLRAISQGAYRVKGKQRVLAKLDARLGEWYWGVYELGVEGVMELLGSEHVGEAPHDADTILDLPHAQDIATIARVENKRGNVRSLEAIHPVYIRNTVAQKMR